ncbi:uncharacterized protein PITG_07404 [Phytophthora infestans T30-4]|uniref:Uncharacterized protein n=1 Tax=Phytophthora infestans (strain T30-4) TaxID=403677 RepID=D0N8B6_PHYIT|nr:uncharacterized protein PITG_07404 [Phytophthora infestans T30-4]EEY53801.1 conserved hypothetical protein [Phytophthora infestans T30-4]|eukprot:XP_002904432.1 conserved hypothetical protein [Phytophthora infestans T30-4]
MVMMSPMSGPARHALVPRFVKTLVATSKRKPIQKSSQTLGKRRLQARAAAAAPSNTPFQRISLSSVNEDELQVITTTLVDANFEQYQEFDGVDSKFWKLVQIKNHIRLYTEKRRKQQADSGPDLYSMLCVGSISGALDDLMSGTVKRANDPSGAALLSTVQEPTMEDPVQSITLKWMDLDVRRRTMGIVKNRDYVYVEATGIKYLPSGGRVGYHFMHSVDIPETHSLPDRVGVSQEASRCRLILSIQTTQLLRSTYQAASQYLKNVLDAKDDPLQQQKINAWMVMDTALRTQIKDGSLGVLQSNDPVTPHTSAQLVAKIGSIELLQKATLECLGYLCDELEEGAIDE